MIQHFTALSRVGAPMIHQSDNHESEPMRANRQGDVSPTRCWSGFIVTNVAGDIIKYYRQEEKEHYDLRQVEY